MFRFLDKIKEGKIKEDETVESLTNKLIVKLKEEGKSIGSPNIANDFGSLTVFAHGIGNETASLKLLSNDWEIEVKAYFEKF